jgi:hypothetical protein
VAGHIFKTKKLDLSINCMREVAELSKSAIFGGGDYNDRADSTEENSAGKTPKKKHT